MSMSRTAVGGILLLSVLLLQGCGRKGALFMPQEPLSQAPAAQAHPEPSPEISSQIAPTLPASSAQPASSQTETRK
ncbi:MAG: hypothetical protein B7Y56_05910 [Gallionellales bacterium 35-53-114]|jgi:predicted small lipoprotein YifL|nr:MAG: hypothetical protein B7Y56_05910 [Gallionellales bacterium 35-53-114]OYZ63736.1 MAG: hypothetical protein B7Y04_07015 [Gallionellales bacterium 24-53-125]OZB09432.1 MAG: hypothetical protein B7X61_07200 [Gallionellales bacterium 39-52-133]HQS57909.1 lipoprotein [Gallionellaceae bacterium]HQS76070.1 lipoprotein [Gallionellaceae bacterium]